MPSSEPPAPASSVAYSSTTGVSTEAVAPPANGLATAPRDARRSAASWNSTSRKPSRCHCGRIAWSSRPTALARIARLLA